VETLTEEVHPNSLNNPSSSRVVTVDSLNLQATVSSLSRASLNTVKHLVYPLDGEYSVSV
jgi:hypothetical protein